MKLSFLQHALTAFVSVRGVAVATALNASSALKVETVHSFGLGSWTENLAIRATGEILPAMLTSPSLYQVDPTGRKEPVLIHTFPPPVASLFGVTETFPDIFYVVAGNMSISASKAAHHSFSIWEVDLTKFTGECGSARVRKVVDVPNAGTLDGATTLKACEGTILISDPLLGVVWKLDTFSGNITQDLSLPDMKPVAGGLLFLGVNGVRVCGDTLYYTSTDQQLFASLPINPDGTAAGSPGKNISTNIGDLDDFALDPAGDAFLVSDASSLIFVESAGGTPEIIAGGLNTTTLPGITCAKFGRTAFDRETLYIGATGGYEGYLTGNFTVPGGILKIDLSGSGYYNRGAGKTGCSCSGQGQTCT